MADKVVVATGLDYTERIPELFRALPRELCSHTADAGDLRRFRGKEIIVIGAGQSALETAALLREIGASVHVLVRRPALLWNEEPKPRTLFDRVRYPTSPLGDGLQLWLYSSVPMLFRYLPEQTRLAKVGCVLGPAGAWWLKDRVLGSVRISLGHSVSSAREKGGRIFLRVDSGDGCSSDLAADHVIAATGYRFDVDRLPFLSPTLRTWLRTAGQQPVLSPHFESSVPGLYFTGFASATWFGPSMRFLCGAKFTAERLSRHLAAGQRQTGSPSAIHLDEMADVTTA